MMAWLPPAVPSPGPQQAQLPHANLGFACGELSPAVALAWGPVAKGWCVGHLPDDPVGFRCPLPHATPSGSVLLSEPKANLGAIAAPPTRFVPSPNCCLHWLSSVFFV